jgi:hypothetical protein
MSLVSVLGCGTWFFPIEEQLYWNLSSNNLQAISRASFLFWILIAVCFIVDIVRVITGTISRSDSYIGRFPFSPILLGITLIFWAGIDRFCRLKFARLGNLNFEIGEDEKLYITEIVGTCPICNCEVTLKNTPKGSDLKVMGFCTWNRDMHTFSFDYTTFTGTYFRA